MASEKSWLETMRRSLPNEHNKSVVLDLVAELDTDESYESREALSGEIFVTGSLEHYKSRTELKKEIELGGRWLEVLSKNTSYLVTNNPESGSSKNKAAAGTRCKNHNRRRIRTMLGY